MNKVYAIWNYFDDTMGIAKRAGVPIPVGVPDVFIPYYYEVHKRYYK